MALVAASIGLVVMFEVIYLRRGFVPGDAFTYLAAGERLNAGHPLYALSPGDRPVDLHPPYWTVPLLSPPPIAVLWRPLALLGDAGAYLWWLAGVGTIIGVLAALYRRLPELTSVAVLVLIIPLTYELGVGNVNPFLLAGTVGVWLAVRRGSDGIAGTLVALLVAVKLTPATLLWWLLFIWRPRGVVMAVAAGIVLACLSVLGAGIGAHIDYLRVVGQTASTGTSDGSLAGIARSIGAPADVARFLPELVLGVGLAGIVLLRRRPAAAYVVAVTAMIGGSVVININWPTMLLAVLAPLAWPPVPAFAGLSVTRQANEVPHAAS